MRESPGNFKTRQISAVKPKIMKNLIFWTLTLGLFLVNLTIFGQAKPDPEEKMPGMHLLPTAKQAHKSGKNLQEEYVHHMYLTGEGSYAPLAALQFSEAFRLEQLDATMKNKMPRYRDQSFKDVLGNDETTWSLKLHQSPDLYFKSEPGPDDMIWSYGWLPKPFKADNDKTFEAGWYYSKIPPRRIGDRLNGGIPYTQNEYILYLDLHVLYPNIPEFSGDDNPARYLAWILMGCGNPCMPVEIPFKEISEPKEEPLVENRTYQQPVVYQTQTVVEYVPVYAGSNWVVQQQSVGFGFSWGFGFGCQSAPMWYSYCGAVGYNPCGFNYCQNFQPQQSFQYVNNYEYITNNYFEGDTYVFEGDTYNFFNNEEEPVDEDGNPVLGENGETGGNGGGPALGENGEVTGDGNGNGNGNNGSGVLGGGIKPYDGGGVVDAGPEHRSESDEYTSLSSLGLSSFGEEPDTFKKPTVPNKPSTFVEGNVSGMTVGEISPTNNSEISTRPGINPALQQESFFNDLLASRDDGLNLSATRPTTERPTTTPVARPQAEVQRVPTQTGTSRPSGNQNQVNRPNVVSDRPTSQASTDFVPERPVGNQGSTTPTSRPQATRPTTERPTTTPVARPQAEAQRTPAATRQPQRVPQAQTAQRVPTQTGTSRPSGNGSSVRPTQNVSPMQTRPPQQIRPAQQQSSMRTPSFAGNTRPSGGGSSFSRGVGSGGSRQMSRRR